MRTFNFLRTAVLTTAATLGLWAMNPAEACTGISLRSKDGAKVIGRTMEWGGFYMESHLMVVPRGYVRWGMTPSGEQGMKFVSKYGYTGIGVLDGNYAAEAINEKGLMGELFYFPGGVYEAYDPANNATTICDVQFLDWALGNFATIEELLPALKQIHVVGYGHGFDSAHFNLADATGRQVVVEYIGGKLHVFENEVGIITNAPEFDWHLTNLRNYINLAAGTSPTIKLASGTEFKTTGVGSAAAGLPGALTPPARFVRAAFYAYTAPQQETSYRTTMQIFQLLNNFDIPIGTEFDDPAKFTKNLLSATQWTTVSDLKEMKFYYRTEWNSMIRCIDLKKIDFGKVAYQQKDLDRIKEQPIEYIEFK